MTRLVIDRPAAHVVRLRLDGPKTLNALNDAVIEELTAAIRDIGTNNDDRIVLLTGTGRAFCAGGDVRDMGVGRASHTINVLSHWRLVIEGLVGLSKPVVAAVNGLASGAGFNLALAADLIVAAPSAWFQQSFVRIGLIPDLGGTYLLAQQIGLHRAKRALLTGQRFSSQEALELGFVSEIFEEGFDEQAVAYCAQLALSAPLAMGMTKLLANRAVEGTLIDALDREAMAQGVLATTEDHASALAAFANKEDLDSVRFRGR